MWWRKPFFPGHIFISTERVRRKGSICLSPRNLYCLVLCLFTRGEMVYSENQCQVYLVDYLVGLFGLFGCVSSRPYNKHKSTANRKIHTFAEFWEMRGCIQAMVESVGVLLYMSCNRIQTWIQKPALIIVQSVALARSSQVPGSPIWEQTCRCSVVRKFSPHLHIMFATLEYPHSCMLSLVLLTLVWRQFKLLCVGQPSSVLAGRCFQF